MKFTIMDGFKFGLGMMLAYALITAISYLVVALLSGASRGIGI